MLYDNFSSVSQNVLKFYQQLTGEERKIPFIFDAVNNYILLVLLSKKSNYYIILIQPTFSVYCIVT